LYGIQYKGNGIGNLDIMAYTYGANNEGYLRLPLLAWARSTIEWQSCTLITELREYITIAPSTACFRIRRIEVDPTKPKYILLENEKQINFDFNFGNPASICSEQQWQLRSRKGGQCWR
jgi:hypothetical protein